MLKVTKSTTIMGHSYIGDEIVVYLSATINQESGGSSVNQAIQNKELYEKNKTACRKDIQEFQSYIYELEDQHIE